MKRLILLICALLLVSAPAWAAKKGRKKSRSAAPVSAPANETYSAMDANPMEASASAILLPDGARDQAAGVAAGNADRATPPSLGGITTSELQVPAPAAPAKWQGVPFDQVPTDKADGVARRLRLVEQLLRKHGRAYDYRVLTVKELEEILSSLDQGAS